MFSYTTHTAEKDWFSNDSAVNISDLDLIRIVGLDKEGTAFNVRSF